MRRCINAQFRETLYRNRKYSFRRIYIEASI